MYLAPWWYPPPDSDGSISYVTDWNTGMATAPRIRGCGSQEWISFVSSPQLSIAMWFFSCSSRVLVTLLTQCDDVNTMIVTMTIWTPTIKPDRPIYAAIADALEADVL